MTSSATLDTDRLPFPRDVVRENASAQQFPCEGEERAWIPSPRCLEILQTLNATFNHMAEKRDVH